MPSSTSEHNPHDKSKTNTFSTQLKKLYRAIFLLESKILVNSGETQDKNRVAIKGYPSSGSEEAEKARLKEVIEDHKTYNKLTSVSILLVDTLANLSEPMLELLAVSSTCRSRVALKTFLKNTMPFVSGPALVSFREPAAFLSQTSTSVIALEYLQEFISYHVLHRPPGKKFVHRVLCEFA